jgi:CRISPR system Cascade subunit CasA
MMRHSLLDDPLFRVRTGGEAARGRSLPQVLDALMETDDVSFEALQPHQKQAWHCFLTQLAAMAVAREIGGEPPTDAGGWRDALVGLAKGSEAAWHLVVSDLSEPAFLQPPLPDEDVLNVNSFKTDTNTPDQLDMLVTSKSHDLKARRIEQPALEHWIFALLTLQTMQGQLGSGNYGISRMNKGYANRPFVGLTPSLSSGGWFRRDLKMLLESRADTAETYDYDLTGKALLWIVPWDGEEPIDLRSCDPHYIETCRRIRFDSDMKCYKKGSGTYRLSPSHGTNGITGDPWAPINREDKKVLNPSGGAFSYDMMHRILFTGTYTKPPSLKPIEGEENIAYVVAQTLAREQGGTEGLYERVIQISGYNEEYFGEGPAAAQIAAESERRLERIDDVRSKVLEPSIRVYIKDHDEDLSDDEQDAFWSQVNRFDEAVDPSFFERLWETPDLTDEERYTFWDDVLLDAARTVFEESDTLCPKTSGRYWDRKSQATSIFEGALRNTLTSATAFNE